MGFYDRLTGKKSSPTNSAAGKNVFVFKEGSKGWGVVFKKAYIEDIFNSQDIPATLNEFILMFAAKSAELPRDLANAHFTAMKNGSKFVEMHESGRNLVEPELTPDWDVPCYLVLLYEYLKL